MLNIDKVDTVYLACRTTDLRKSIDGLAMLVEMELKIDPFEKALFVFCNKKMNRVKVLHFDQDFCLYYYRIENRRLKGPMTKEELSWPLKGYEVITTSKFKKNYRKNHY